MYRKYRKIKEDGNISELLWYKNDEYRRTHQLCPKCKNYGYTIHKIGDTGEHNNRCFCCGFSDTIIYNKEQIKDYILIKNKLAFSQESANGYIALLMEDNEVFKIILKKYVNPKEINIETFNDKYKGFSLIVCNPIEHQIEIIAGKMKDSIIKMDKDIWAFTTFKEEQKRKELEKEKELNKKSKKNKDNK